MTVYMMENISGFAKSRVTSFFLPNMEWYYPFTYLQSLSIQRKMKWNPIKAQDGVLLGNSGSNEVFFIGASIRLSLSSSWEKEYFLGETPIKMNTLLNQFIYTGREFPSQDFQPLRWVHSRR